MFLEFVASIGTAVFAFRVIEGVLTGRMRVYRRSIWSARSTDRYCRTEQPFMFWASVVSESILAIALGVIAAAAFLGR
jgi:hypothetical protein